MILSAVFDNIFILSSGKYAMLFYLTFLVLKTVEKSLIHENMSKNVN